MKLSQSMAEQIAGKIAEPKYKEFEAANKALSKAVTEHYNSLIPKSVFQEKKKNPEYFATAGTIYLKGLDFNFHGVNVDGEHVISNNINASTWQNAVLVLGSTVTGIKIKDLHKKAAALKKEYTDLRSELTNAIKTLGTAKRVSINLPEAIPFLPNATGRELAIDLTKLREKLKTL